MRAVRAALALMLLPLGAAACAAAMRAPVGGDVTGHRIVSALDGAVAERTLAELSAGLTPGHPAVAAALAGDGLPTFEDLRGLTQATSVDTATLVLIARLARLPEHAAAQNLYARYLARLRAWGRAGWPLLAACMAGADLPEIHFVPGWFYRSNPATGADFAAQRRLFAALGLGTALIEIDENGAVDDNAAVIAAHLRARPPERRVILVSTSKGGPEAAHALGALLTRDEAAPVRAWVNVGGVLRGSPLADLARTWPLSWLAWAALAWDGIDGGDSIDSLTTARSMARLHRQHLPAHLAVFHYVGVPLSGQITVDARDGYDRLRRFGPNDGLTPLAHQWAHPGAIVMGIGLDHFYRDAEIDLKTAAMAFTVLERLGETVPRDCVRP
jgi:hypothetical protein